jgi:hypothetical protein
LGSGRELDRRALAFDLRLRQSPHSFTSRKGFLEVGWGINDPISVLLAVLLVDPLLE